MSAQFDDTHAAALRTLSMGMVHCRKLALEGSSHDEQIAQLMDAMHEVPNLLLRKAPGFVAEVRNHFGCYDGKRWSGWDLVGIFDSELRRGSDGGAGT